MGAWGILFDENDDAADWLANFGDQPGWEAVDEAFTAADGDYIEAPDASQALAAAEVVAAALGRPSDRISETGKWAALNAAGAQDRKETARNLVARIRDDSELHELWQESDEYADWRQSVDETLSRLA